MNLTFSKYLKKQHKLMKELVSILGEQYSYVSILGTDCVGKAISVNKLTTSVKPLDTCECGFVVKVYFNNSYYEYAFNELNSKNLHDILKSINDYVNDPINVSKVVLEKIEEEPLKKNFQRKIVGNVLSDEEIINELHNCIDDTLTKYSTIINVYNTIRIYSVSKTFISKDKELTQFYVWSNSMSMCYAKNEDNIKYAYDSYGANSIEDVLNYVKTNQEEVAKLAIALLDSKPPVPGYYDVITDPSITGLIAHEAFGHGVEMDMFVKDRALAKEYMGKRVATPCVNMKDGAKAVLSAASYFFDDDGILAQSTQIIKNGILKNGISDVLSALQLGTKPTGNGRRESFSHKAYTRMTNTFFEKGKDKLEDMIKSIEHGYMLFTTNNGMEDPKNWGIQCTALYGKEIKNGEFTGNIVSPVVLSGNVLDLLNSITAVSDEFKVIGSGSCGKGYKEWVYVSDGGPHLKAKVRIG